MLLEFCASSTVGTVGVPQQTRASDWLTGLIYPHVIAPERLERHCDWWIKASRQKATVLILFSFFFFYTKLLFNVISFRIPALESTQKQQCIYSLQVFSSSFELGFCRQWRNQSSGTLSPKVYFLFQNKRMWKPHRADVANISSVTTWRLYCVKSGPTCAVIPLKTCRNFDFYQSFKCRRKEQLKPSGGRERRGRADPGAVSHLCFCSVSSRVISFPVDVWLADSGELFHLANSSTLTHSEVMELFKLWNCWARSGC